MTVRELVFLLDEKPWWMVSYFVGLPLMAWLMSIFHGTDRGSQSPWKYFYSAFVYLACAPGVFSAVLTGYVIFFTRENLLDASLLIHVAPIISMFLTLAIIRKSLSFDEIPGFDRLSGLITMIAVTFIFILGLYKTKIWVLFGGSVFVFAAIAVGLFALMKWGAYTAFRSKKQPKLKAPSFDIRR